MTLNLKNIDLTWFLAIFGCKRMNYDEMDGDRLRLPANRNCYRLSRVSWALLKLLVVNRPLATTAQRSMSHSFVGLPYRRRWWSSHEQWSERSLRSFPDNIWTFPLHRLQLANLRPPARCVSNEQSTSFKYYWNSLAVLLAFPCFCWFFRY